MHTTISSLSTKNGLLYYMDEIIDLLQADIEARKYGFQYAELLVKALIAKQTCPECLSLEILKPLHFGSPSCGYGSVASGGNKLHCTCDICF